MREQACKPNSGPRRTEVAIIPLAPTLLAGSSDLPESSPIAAAERQGPGTRNWEPFSKQPFQGHQSLDPSPCLQRRYRRWAERAAPPLLFGLAPCGVYRASGIAARAVRSYFNPRRFGAAPFHPYPPSVAEAAEKRAVCFLWHFPCRRRTALADILLRPSPLASTLPCGVRTFLSPAPRSLQPSPCGPEAGVEAGQRSPGLLAQVL